MVSRFWRAGGNALRPDCNFLADVAVGGFTPTSLANLAAWYDAEQQTEANGAAVSQFTDRSGNGKHFTAAAGQEFTMRFATVGSKKGLDTGGGRMSCSGLLSGATAGAFFAVLKMSSDPTAGDGPLLDNFTSGSFTCHQPFSDGIIYDGFGLTARQTCGDPSPSLASPTMYAAIAGTGDYRFLVNNATLYSTAAATIGFGTGTRWMGASAAGPGSYTMAGYIAEVIILSAVPSSTDIANIRSYFNTKFGTSF